MAGAFCTHGLARNTGSVQAHPATALNVVYFSQILRYLANPTAVSNVRDSRFLWIFFFIPNILGPAVDL